MEPAETKEAQPRLVENPSPANAVADTANAPKSVEITSNDEKTQLAFLSPQASLVNVAPPTFASVHGENDATDNRESAVEEKPPLVISIWDLLALFLYGFGIVAMIIYHPSGPTETQPLNWAAYFLGFNVAFGSYWLRDVYQRLHQALGQAKSLGAKVDSWLTINPLIYAGLIWMFVFGLRAILPQEMVGVLARTTATVFPLIFLATALRWLYLNLTLGFKAASMSEVGSTVSPNKISKIGTAAGMLMLAPIPIVFAPTDASTVLMALVTGMTGICFVVLRNAILQGSPSMLQAMEHKILAAAASDGEVQIAYNHFVEIQRWFKQRFALRSPWKIGLLVLILTAAVAGHLHNNILNFFTNNLGSIASGTAATTAAGSAAAGTNLNSIGNSVLVMAFGWIMFGIGAGSLFAFVRAPKKK